MPGAAQPGTRGEGLLAAFVWGLICGLALGACTFAHMAPMLAATNLSNGRVLLLFYGVGHCSVIVLAGIFSEVVQHYPRLNEKSKGVGIAKKICGALVILAGLSFESAS